MRKLWIWFRRYGGLAQLGERLPCKQEVTGSIPVLSTKEIDWNGTKGLEAKAEGTGVRFHWVSWEIEELKDAPWKLNIVIIDAILWEGNSKGKLLN